MKHYYTTVLRHALRSEWPFIIIIIIAATISTFLTGCLKARSAGSIGPAITDKREAPLGQQGQPLRITACICPV